MRSVSKRIRKIFGHACKEWIRRDSIVWKVDLDVF